MSPAPTLREVGRRRPYPRERLAAHATEAARGLLGALLVRVEDDGSHTLARLVEVEAYREDDPASHSHGGMTERTAPMFGPPGTAYVYRSYGVHWCLNVACEEAGTGAAVLLRSAIALTNRPRLHDRRGRDVVDRDLLRGPGVLTRTLAIDDGYGATDLCAATASLRLETDGFAVADGDVARGPRVGVSRAAEVPWRFHVSGEPAVSRYSRSPRAPQPPGEGSPGGSEGSSGSSGSSDSPG